MQCAEHPNVATLESLYCGDRHLFDQRLSPEYVSHTPGGSQVAGTFRGLSAHRAHGRQLRDLCDGEFKVHLRAPIIADDCHALVPTRVCARRGQRVLEMDAFGLYRFCDGWIVEHWIVPDDLVAFDTFWGSEPED